jgi:hypothetical protein
VSRKPQRRKDWDEGYVAEVPKIKPLRREVTDWLEGEQINLKRLNHRNKKKRQDS